MNMKRLEQPIEKLNQPEEERKKKHPNNNFVQIVFLMKIGKVHGKFKSSIKCALQ